MVTADSAVSSDVKFLNFLLQVKYRTNLVDHMSHLQRLRTRCVSNKPSYCQVVDVAEWKLNYLCLDQWNYSFTGPVSVLILFFCKKKWRTRTKIVRMRGARITTIPHKGPKRYLIVASTKQLRLLRSRISFKCDNLSETALVALWRKIFLMKCTKRFWLTTVPNENLLKITAN